MNEFHIEDSPAKEYLKKLNDFSMRKVIDKFGNVFYYNEKGHIHREDGPAVEYSFGNKYWYKNGKLHREYGPAIEYVEGDKEYWYNDIWYKEIKTDEGWVRFVKLMVFI